MNNEIPNDNSENKEFELVRLNALVTHETNNKLRFLADYKEVSATEIVRRSVAIYSFGLSLESKGSLIVAHDGDSTEQEDIDLPTDLLAENDEPDVSLNCNLNIPTRHEMDKILMDSDIDTDGELIDKAVEYYLRLAEKAANGYSLKFEDDGKRREIVLG